MSLASAALLGACGGDDDDDPSGPGGDITGTWGRSNGDEVAYLVITGSTVTSYSNFAGCFVETGFAIVDHDGDEYELEVAGSTGESFLVEIRRSGDDLLVDGARFESSNVDVGELDLCAPLELPACNTLTELTVQEIGSLETSDPTYFGSYYDLYRIEVETTSDVQIDMSSNDLDSYLILFDAEGDQIAFNDDTGPSLHAQIQVELAPGCYIVMATSALLEETGGYTLILN